MNTRLEKAFEYVRQTFFPRWDRKRKWVVKVDPNFPGTGNCDIENKTITLAHISANKDDFHSLLIHEICHAAAGYGHAKKFLGRYQKAADKAKEIGRRALAEMIYDEIERYGDPKKHVKVNANLVYETIGECVLADPNIPYEDVIKYVAQTWSHYPEEIEKRFKRCRAVYEETVKDMKAYELLEEKYKNLIKKGGESYG